jgi:hypothetical protein
MYPAEQLRCSLSGNSSRSSLPWHGVKRAADLCGQGRPRTEHFQLRHNVTADRTRLDRGHHVSRSIQRILFIRRMSTEMIVRSSSVRQRSASVTLVPPHMESATHCVPSRSRQAS